MTSAAGSPSKAKKPVSSPERTSKGKGKNTEPIADDAMEEDEDEEEEDDDEDEEMEEYQEDDDDDDEEVEEDPEIDPSAIVGRRTRGVRVDYTSKEALAKAGLKSDEDDDDYEDAKHK